MLPFVSQTLRSIFTNLIDQAKPEEQPEQQPEQQPGQQAHDQTPAMADIDKLPDLVLIHVFRHLNLNERTTVRRVSRRWRSVADSITIKRLCINQARPPLAYDDRAGERWHLNDSVRVISLNRFFNSAPIQKALKQLNKLMIFGQVKIEVVDIKPPFELNELSYLRLSSVDFTNTNILKSPKLEVLILFNCLFDRALYGPRCVQNELDYKTALKSLRGQIKKLVIKDVQDDDRLKILFKSNVLAGLEELEVRLYDFEIFRHSAHFPKSLRSINCSVAPSFEDLDEILRETKLKPYLDRLPPDLNVMLFNVPLGRTKESIVAVKRFFRKMPEFAENLLVDYHFTIGRENQYELGGLRLSHLDAFLQKMNSLEFSIDRVSDEMNKHVLSKLSHITGLIVTFTKKHELDFEQFLSKFPALTMLKVFTEVAPKDLCEYGNRELDLIPEKCKRMVSFSAENYTKENLDFGFLFRMPSLAEIQLYLWHPIDSAVLADLIRKLRYLSSIEVYFVHNGSMSKQWLKSIKDRLDRLLYEELKMKRNDATFKIFIHTGIDAKVVRYLYQRLSLTPFPNPPSDHERVVSAAQMSLFGQMLEVFNFK